jgi:hypothetical protein
MAIKGQTETVTPALAQKYLESMTTNRPLRHGVVEFYAREMSQGLWKSNGQGLIFDEGGHMLDGQHRCWAVIESNLNVDMMVTRGVKKEAFDTIDTGAMRSAGDVLGMKSWDYAKPLAAALRWANAWANGFTRSTGGKQRLSNHEVAVLADKYPTLTDHVSYIYGGGGKSSLGRKSMQRAGISFARWVTHESHPLIAAEFWQKIETGEGLNKSDPEYLFRERLHEDYNSSRKMVDRTLVAFCILAWNAKVTGAPIKILRFREEDEFPSVAGDLLGPSRAKAITEAKTSQKRRKIA